MEARLISVGWLRGDAGWRGFSETGTAGRLMRNVLEGIPDPLSDNSLKPKWPAVCFRVRKSCSITEKCLLER